MNTYRNSHPYVHTHKELADTDVKRYSSPLSLIYSSVSLPAHRSITHFLLLLYSSSAFRLLNFFIPCFCSNSSSLHSLLPRFLSILHLLHSLLLLFFLLLQRTLFSSHISTFSFHFSYPSPISCSQFLVRLPSLSTLPRAFLRNTASPSDNSGIPGRYVR